MTETPHGPTDWPTAEVARRWRDARALSPSHYLNAAACNVPSDRVLAAMVDHLAEERRVGGFRAADDAAPVLAEGKAALARFAGASAADVGFLENGTSAMAALLTGLRLPAGARIGLVRSEFGSTRLLVNRLAAERGWNVVEIPVDDDSRILTDQFEVLLSTGLDLVPLGHIASQRGVVQPAREVGRLCRAAGVPLILDVCQSLGHVDVSGVGAAAYVGTSRKWLAGPRGVGFVIVPGLAAGGGWDTFSPTIHTHGWGKPSGTPLAAAARFETEESSIAARVGLSVAAREHWSLGPADVYAPLAAMGRATREMLDGVGGWRVAEPVNEPSAIVTLSPPDTTDPDTAVATALGSAQMAGIHIGAIPVSRAPADMPTPRLRISLPLGAERDSITALARVLDQCFQRPLPTCGGGDRES
jgi:pyridoxal 5-phosphate dependent beta-lyase